MEKPYYVNWILKESGIVFNDGMPVESYKISYDMSDERALDNWALHLRRHYISDSELEESIDELGISKEDYLKSYKIPGRKKPGPSTRASDITEILVADMLQFLMNYEVPRIKQQGRANKDMSTPGTDVIGFRFEKSIDNPSRKDELVAAEVKAVLSKKSFGTITDAVKDSKKDKFRIATTLDYYRQTLKRFGDNESAKKIARFQIKSEMPYSTKYEAFAITKIEDIDSNTIIEIAGKDLGLDNSQQVYFIHGKDLMDLTNAIFDRCNK